MIRTPGSSTPAAPFSAALPSGAEPQSLLLRRFERALLEGMGVAPDFEFDAASGEAISPEGLYHLQAEAGFVPVSGPARACFGAALFGRCNPAAPTIARRRERCAS